MSEIITIPEAARMTNVTRQAIYLAVKIGRLKAYKSKNMWQINIKDMQEYNTNKYSRMHHTILEGKKLYNETKGPYTVEKVANMLCVDRQKIYYEIRCGRLKVHKYGSAFVIYESEVKKYADKYMK